MGRLQPILGLCLIALIAYALSTNRRAIRLRTMAWGFGLQFLFAVIVLKTGAGQRTFEVLGDKIRQLLAFSTVGSSFVFGPIGNQSVWSRIMTTVLGPEGAQYGTIFAFQIAPTVIFIAALFAILYYFGIMQIVVRLFAIVMNRVMGASGAESLNVAASIFMGQTEAPLTIRPVPATHDAIRADDR
jgi:CNT family concentrative nucleoside transporter